MSDKISDDCMLNDLLKYYEVKMSALSAYSDCVWTRFNWFLTLQLAFLGFFFTQIDQLSIKLLLAKGIPVVGIVVAALWALMGAEDYFSMQRHRIRTKLIDSKIKDLYKDLGSLLSRYKLNISNWIHGSTS
jgi:hypothetical protein